MKDPISLILAITSSFDLTLSMGISWVIPSFIFSYQKIYWG